MSLFETLRELERRGEAAALCTVVRARGSVPRHPGSKMVVRADGSVEGSVGGGLMESRVIEAALLAMRTGEAQLVRYDLVDPASGDVGVCGGQIEVFVDPLRPQPVLLIVGGGHIGRALVHLGKWLGFRVVLSDDRPEFCDPDAAPGADAYLPVPAAELARSFQFTSETYIVLPTRSMPVDVEVLPHLLDVPRAYLGVIGSRRRWATARRKLEESGVPREKLDRVHAPMGLELNAETPEEIALSILAEIVMLRRHGTGASMREPPAENGG
jgi:xanthine dehydrogenase accessory factor